MTTTRPPRVFTCRDCPNSITEKQASYSGLCATCTRTHIDAWKAEHTRKGPSDKRKGWLIGDLCTVTTGGITHDGKIIDMSDIRSGNYLWVKLEITYTATDFNGKEFTRIWVHPSPVQSYKLRKRV